MSRIATTDATETPTVTRLQRRPVSTGPASDCSSQKVLLVTCTANSDPAPAARAISTGSRPMSRGDRREDARGGDGGDGHRPDGDVQDGGDDPDDQQRAAVLAVKYSPRMSPRPAAAMVAASDPPTPVRMRIWPLSLKPVAIAFSTGSAPTV